jgi:hypothetical protein
MLDERWAYKFRHPHFGWLRWEPGDKTYATRAEAERLAAESPYKTRIVRIVNGEHRYERIL